jgi:dTDP-4-amino-4,6-dideoxygalactose transaminase
MKNRIYLSPPHMGGYEMQYITEAFEQNWIAPIGPNVNAFEEDLARYLNVKHVAALSSGTAAIHLALINLGVQAGDEVLVSSLTFSATVNPIFYQNAIPVFIDSEEETWNMCPELLEKAIEDGIAAGKKPKAVIPVHLYGVPAKIDSIMAIADKYHIPVIEDAAESLGSRFAGRHTGTTGEMGILSFNGNKIITTSGGGALISDNEQFIKNARYLSTQARDDFPWYHHTQIGFNYRMSNVVAGIGRGQLQVLDERVKMKREIFGFYKNIFKDIEGISFSREPDDSFASRWLTCILIDPAKTGGRTPKGLIEAFELENIESRYIWKPMHTQPVFIQFPAYLNGVSERIFQNGVCLPSGTSMNAEDMDRIAKVIRKYFCS